MPEFFESQEERLFTGQLRRDIQVFPGQPDESGLPTWLLFDPVSDKYFRLSEREHLMVSLLYENKPIEEFYDKSISLGSTIDKNGVLNVISFLMENNLMASVYGGTEKRLAMQKEKMDQSFWSRLASSYLFFKAPLVSPDAFITRSFPYVNAALNKWSIMALALISVSGYASALVNWSRLTEAVSLSLTMSGLFKYALAVIVLKAFHELSHAYTAKSMGVRVRRFGVGLMVFFPRFYTDITDSWRVRSPAGRALIDAAGILFELLAGGFAALLWVNSPPGVVNTIAYYVFAVTAVNTVLVNGNPFIKYDGYYILMDLSRIDNLQQRSLQAANDILLKYLFGIRRSRRLPLESKAKSAFLAVFGFASFLYRIFLYTSIILIIYYKFTKALGIALVALEIYILVLRPLVNQARLVMAYRSKMKAFNVAATSAFAAGLAILLLAPIPWRLPLPCEVKADRNGVLYAQVEGFLKSIDAKAGSSVAPGQTLLSLSNPDLEMDLSRKEAEIRMASLECDRLSASPDSIPSAQLVEKKVEVLKGEASELRRRLALLEIKAPVDGSLFYYDPDIQTSKWIRKGEAIGEVFNPATAQLVAFAKESELPKINPGDRAFIALEGELSEIPGAVKSVSRIPETAPSPSPLLSVSGGSVQTVETPDGLAFSEPVYQIIVEPDDKSALHEGRSGVAFLRKPQSIALSAANGALQWIKRILTF